MKFRHFYLMLTLGALAFTAWVVGRYIVRAADAGGFFPVRQVQVYGLSNYSVRDLVRRSGLRAGESLVFIDTDALRRQIEAVARLRVRSIERKFPETLVFRMEERSGMAVVLCGPESLEVDGKGEVLARGNEILDWDKPMLRLIGVAADEACSNQRLKDFLSTLDALPEGERDFTRLLSEVVLGDEVELFPRSPRVRLSLGVRADLDQLRRARYALLFAETKGLKARRIDLRTDPVKYVL